MSRNRVIYNTKGVFVGPSPDNNFHFMGYTGNFINDPQVESKINLIKHLPRVQNFTYNLSVPKANLLQLGKMGSVRQRIVEPPSIDLSFEYLQTSVLNEARLGFYVNYPKGYPPNADEPYYNNTFDVFLLSGFYNRTDERAENPLRWPYAYRDKRNIYVAINNIQDDLQTQNDEYFEIDPNAKNWAVYCFGGCYIRSYTAQAAVGDFARVSVNYTADNISFHTSGSGVSIPSVDVKTFTGYNDIKFALPSPNDGLKLPSALLPGDITVDISSKPQMTGVPAIFGGTYVGDLPSNYSTVKNLGADFNDIKLQSYSLSIDLDRKEQKTLGYRLPVDKQIIFPTFATLSFEALIGDNFTGSVDALYRLNDDYDITVNLKNPIKPNISGYAVKYFFKSAKLESYEYNATIGTNDSITFNYRVQLDPQDLNQGLFVSGQMNTDDVGSSKVFSDRWITESGDYVVTELGDKIYVNSYILYY